VARAKPTPAAKAANKAGSRRKGAAAAGPTLAEQADRHALYQRAVQFPSADVEFFHRTFRSARGRSPQLLREDFCGTALLSATWAASGPRRRAIGVDLDAPTLAWGQAHNVDTAGRSVARRVSLVHGDVRKVRTEPADIVCAMNFSFCVFHARRELLAYARRVRSQLAEDGMFVAELHGGTEAIVADTQTRELDGGVTYVWQQASFNPIDHRTLCHIHFEFPDGSALRPAFTYDWRLWTLPELRDVLLEAGFRAVEVYWDRVDEDGEGTGEYVRTEVEENQETWLVYVVALR
jgi:SAM-dependent methyltransferase